MPLRRTLGLSLAVLMISTGAFAKTPSKHASHHHRHPASVKSRGAPHASAHHRGHHARLAREHAARRRHRGAKVRSASLDRIAHAVRPVGHHQIGEASWYGLEGARTASGERMNASMVTAAHRSLPLLSYARVTDLDNGRSIIVRINDRGPMNHRFVIDLSRHAAEMLHMKRAGVARVAIQPVVLTGGHQQQVASNQPSRTLSEQ